MFEKIKSIIEAHDCKLLITYDEFITNKLNYRSVFKIIGKCGHEKTIRISNILRNIGEICNNCSRPTKLHFDDVFKIIESKNCKFLISKEIFDPF